MGVSEKASSRKPVNRGSLHPSAREQPTSSIPSYRKESVANLRKEIADKGREQQEQAQEDESQGKV
jgi:hypothetical protein